MGYTPRFREARPHKQKVQDASCFPFTICNNLGRFDAGVTSIQSHPHIENIFAVGRLFDFIPFDVYLSHSGVAVMTTRFESSMLESLQYRWLRQMRVEGSGG